MSKIKELEKKISEYRGMMNQRIEFINNKLQEADKLLKINLAEPYTMDNLPEYVKKMEEKKRRQWLAIFNSAYEKHKDEATAFKMANASIKESVEEDENSEMAKARKYRIYNFLKEVEVFVKKVSEVENKEALSVLVEVQGKIESIYSESSDDEILEKSKYILGLIKESLDIGNVKKEDIKESVKYLDKDSKDLDTLDGFTFVGLEEANFNSDSSEFDVILIEAGTNEDKMRHYTKQAIEESAPDFKGLKMYINHPTAKEDKERPERDLRDWVSTIVESRGVDGQMRARVYVHDNWLRERLKDKVVREHIGLSINASGKIRYGEVNGKKMQIVERIIPKRNNGVASVDWVTEAGARGRVVSPILESRRKPMEFKDISLDELKKERPDLVESISKENANTKEDAKMKQELKEANDKIASFEKGEKLSKQVEFVKSSLKESKLPELTKERIVESFSKELFESEEKLKEAVTEVVKKEAAYLNQLSENGKIKFKSSNDKKEDTLKESLSSNLNDRLGIVEKKEKE